LAVPKPPDRGLHTKGDIPML